MIPDVQIGLVGLDSSHAPLFTRLLNGVLDARPEVLGGHVTAAFAGEPSVDLPLSVDRLSGYVGEVCGELGVPRVGSLDELAEACDAFVITGVDSRRRAQQLGAIVGYGKPVFVDKPFALSGALATAMLERARRAGVIVWGSSSKRFAPALQEALRRCPCPNRVDVIGPLPEQPGIPGLFWYGVHQVEILYTALGAGCASVYADEDGDGVRVEGRWADGRLGTLGGARAWSRHISGTLSGDAGVARFDIDAFSDADAIGQLDAILATFRGAAAPAEPAEIIEIVRFLDAANTSMRTGLRVTL